MALEAITNSIYHDSTLVQKPDFRLNQLNIQEQGVAPIGASETPAVVKVSTENQNSNDKNKQDDNSSKEQLIKGILSKANKSMKNSKSRLELTYHEKIKRVSIKILDEETDEVIREIPPEEALEMIERLYELAGILFDEKA